MSNANELFDASTFLKTLTSQPGVYQMYNSENELLYIGKAKNLKKRVSSYFQKQAHSPKTMALVKRIHNIQITVTPSEAEALVLEHNLIKRHKPPYNIMLRDDKSYPYIFISDGETYPRISFHRGAKRRKGRYFGPYPNAAAVRESLNFLQKTFQVRQCDDSTYSNRSRPCLLYQIARCSGPCVDLVSKDDYADDLQQSVLFLEGKTETLQNKITQHMQDASEKLEFESAAQYRDRLSALRSIQSQQVVESGLNDLDVLACAIEGANICVHVIYVRVGRIIGSRSYFPNDRLADGPEEVLSSFIGQKYLRKNSVDIPSLIVTSNKIDDEGAMSDAISTVLDKKVKITSNVRTYKAQWIAMALEAARQNLKQRVNNKNSLAKRWLALQEALELDEIPNRVECFDISHISGEHTVASCVVFDKDGARKSDYRRFNIEDIQASDDYAAMRQALERRYSRLQKENQNMPELLLVDGGKGQITQAKEILAELGIQEISVIGVAKGPTRKAGLEDLITAEGKVIILSPDHAGLHLIQQIRDEAHRFAVAGHVAGRDKARKRSKLEDIPGIGPKRRRAMLTYFGGIQEVMKASQADIERVPGISKKSAEEVYTALHSE